MKYLLIAFLSSFLLLGCKNSNDTSKETINLSEITLERFCLEQPYSLGKINDVEFFEGGFSGLTFIPEKDSLFVAISDRGPNLKYKVDSIESKIKIFPFPNYNPKLFKLKIEGNHLKIMDTLSLKNFDGSPLVGLPISDLSNQAKELAWENTTGKLLDNSPNGIDAEAVNIDYDGNYWISDEYQSSIWKIDSESGIVLEKYSPHEELIDNEQIFQLPDVFKYRKPNRGFESVSYTEDKHLWSILQSPAWYPSKKAVKDSRLIRILKLNTKTKKHTTFLYEHDEEEGIRQKDWKIGDMVSISNNEFLTLEHASYEDQRYLRIYKLNVSEATSIASGYKKDGKTPEEYKTAAVAKENGIQVVKKTLIMDLADHGFDVEHGKPEGITLMNDYTIVVVNDNDYAIEFDEQQENFINNGVNSCLYIYKLPKSLKDY